MVMIKAQNLQINYGTLTLLADVSFSIGNGQKVALVGYNGTGKTTLLKILAGLEPLDSGKIEIEKDECIGYLPQDTSLSGDASIMDYLRKEVGIDVLEKEIESLSTELTDPKKLERYGEVYSKFEHLDGYSFTHKVEVMLSGFGLEDVGSNRSLSNLSSGQKSKVALAGILLKGVDLLLLDEPTNNLDLPAIIWLEDFLQRSEASCIIVSHDRRFLDRVVKKIFELDWHTHAINITNGTYSDYLETIAKRISGQKEDYRLQQEEIERLNERARESKAKANTGANWSGTDNDKFLRGFKRDRAAGSSKVAKSIEKRIEQMDKVEKPVERKPFEILIKAKDESGNMLVLDEPTNHLDLEALGALEETLKTYKGTILLVSHDRYFLETASLNEAYLLSDGQLTKIPDYKDYIKLSEEKAQKGNAHTRCVLGRLL